MVEENRYPLAFPAIGLAIIGLVTILPGIVLIVLGFFAASNANTALVAGGVGFIAIGVVVLFRFAKDGTVRGGFTEQELVGAARTWR